VSMDHKRALAALFTANLEGKKLDAEVLSQELNLQPAEAGDEIEELVRLGLSRMVNGGAVLTQKGRGSIRVVFLGGGFEVIHYGHVHTLSKARRLGDVLVVSVARDSTIRRRKNREPLVGEVERVKLLSALRDVDVAILGVEGDIYETLEKVKPDLVALGYDQYHLEEEVKKESAKRGLKVDVVRLDSPVPNLKTSSILKEF
jgi:FAD synthetase